MSKEIIYDIAFIGFVLSVFLLWLRWVDRFIKRGFK